jgi:ABC-type transport system involved in cytochrome c biogenesis permease subunit
MRGGNAPSGDSPNCRGRRQTTLGARLFLAFCLALSSGIAAGGEAGAPDFSAWQHLPVFHNGRMLPVNTYARLVVEDVCDGPNPRLSLEGVTDAVRSLPEFAETEKMFPRETRKFPAPELLFSWIVEPERWEYVPFLIAEHETLRKDVFKLPVLSAKGKHLKYVSPYDVENSDGFRRAVNDLAAKRRGTPAKKLKLTGAEAAIEQLYQAYMTYRSVAYDPFHDEPRAFVNAIDTVATTWNETAKAWNGAKDALAIVAPEVYGESVADRIEAVRSGIASAGETMQERKVALRKAEKILSETAHQASELAAIADRGMKEVFGQEPPPAVSESRWRQVRNASHIIASRAADLVLAVKQAQLALFDSQRAVRLLPGLNPAALEKNRDLEDNAQPWVSLQTLLFSGDDVYRTFIRPNLADAESQPISPAEQMSRLELLQLLATDGNPARTERAAFADAAAAYLDRGADDRAERFGNAMERFAAEMRTLGESIEPARAELALRHPDERLIEVTAYPPPGSTGAEVYYYRLDPFKWSWVLSFLALCCLAAALGAIRSPMYWSGLALLIGGQTFSVLGFAMRTYITGWAPVTNMFETVVFVALVTAILGLWFALAPLFGPGLRRAWRMTAVPATPEAGSLDEDDLAMMNAETWAVLRGLMLIPRAFLVYAVFHLLTQVQYGVGTGYTIIRTAPRGDSINDQVVWIVGLSMLALAVWLVPRLVLTAVLGVIALPWSLIQSGLKGPLRKVMDRKASAMVGAGTAFGVGLIAYYAPIWDSNINPLMPVLRDNFWLTLHVLTITASYGAGFLAWGLGITAMVYYVFGRYRDPLAPSHAHIAQGHRPAHGYQAPAEAFRRRVPEQCASLSGFIYKAIQVAVVLLAAGTILGGLWADVSWGRFWGWDSKEVWALISLLIYVGILHFRFIGLFRDFALATGAVFGITSIVMAWWGVNFFLGSGLHSYGDGAGGGWFVLGFMVFNAFAVFAGAVRYFAETGGAATPVLSETHLPGKAVPKPQ